MRCCGSRARGRDENLEVDLGLHFEKINFPDQEKIFRIVSGEVGRLCARGMDAIDPSMRAERWFHLHLAKVTVTTGHSPVPKDLVCPFQRSSVDILFFSADIRDLSNSLVAKDHGESESRVPSFPHVDIRTADPCRLNFHKGLPLFRVWDGKASDLKGLIKFFENHRF
jgi:hypothetical protein